MNKTNHSDRCTVVLLLPMALANKNSSSGPFVRLKSLYKEKIIQGQVYLSFST